VTTTPASRRRRDPAGRRQAIIEAAGRVIAEAGVAGLTHRRVAEVAGVPVGSTTYYFKDLDELREAALADATRSATESLHQWKQALDEHADLPAMLAELTADCIADGDRCRSINELYAAASHRPELRQLARVWSHGLIEVLEPYIGRRTAEMVAVFIDGTVLHGLITEKPLNTASLKEAFVRLTQNDC
jgi:DNA-binding transcriptional regulator YbjK